MTGRPAAVSFRTVSATSAATFQLHCRGAAFLEEPCRITRGLLGRNLIREKRHIGHHQRAVCTSGDRARVMNHYVQSDWDRCVQSHDHISEGITDEQQVDPGSIEQPRHRGIVSGQHDDALTSLFHQGKIRNTNLFRRSRSHDRLSTTLDIQTRRFVITSRRFVSCNISWRPPV